MHEVLPGHFVYCSDSECEKYREEYAEKQKQAKMVAEPAPEADGEENGKEPAPEADGEENGKEAKRNKQAKKTRSVKKADKSE